MAGGLVQLSNQEGELSSISMIKSGHGPLRASPRRESGKGVGDHEKKGHAKKTVSGKRSSISE